MTDTQTTGGRGRIVVGVDGSPSSLTALEWAIGQAALTGASVEAVTSWHVPVAAGGYSIVDATDWRANAEAIQDVAIQEVLGDEAVTVVRRVVQGHPVDVLLHAAAGADLLVVGSRGHGGFAGMLLGSVSQHVVAHAPCVVVVVKAPPNADGTQVSSGTQS
jgi:nucleotide-binding universal stress UspA family protein